MGCRFPKFSFTLALNKRIIIPLLTPLGNHPTYFATLTISENSSPITSQKKVELYDNSI
jgi:hypothetical protein